MDYSNAQQGYTAFEVEDRSSKSSVSSQHLLDRMGFIRKVYSIITIQLCFTTVFCAAAYASASFSMFLLSNPVLFIVFMVLGIAVELAIFCCKKFAKEVPNNYIALFIFTFCESWLAAYLCSFAYVNYTANGGQLVLIAALLTLSITASLTIYAFKTETDFTMQGGALFIFGTVLFFFGILTMFFHSPVLNTIYVCALGILYGFYLIYDTQLIVGGKQHELDIDDYIIGALIIYVDIIMLFIQILQLLLEIFGKRQ